MFHSLSFSLMKTVLILTILLFHGIVNYSLNKYLLRTYNVPGTILGVADAVVHKQKKNRLPSYSGKASGKRQTLNIIHK